MPLSDSQRQQILINRGLNPQEYTIAPDDQTIISLDSSESIQPTAGPTILQPKVNPNPSGNNSFLQTFAKSAADAAPSALGAGYFAGQGALYGSGLGPFGTLGGGLLGAIGGGLLTRFLQKKVEPEAWQQNVQQAQAEHPMAALAGSVATMPLGGFNPSIKNLLSAGRGGIAALSGMGAAAEDVPNMVNVGIGAGLGAVQPAAESLVTGHGLPPIEELLKSAALGALFNKPNSIGNKFGFHSPEEQPQQLPDLRDVQYSTQPQPDVNANPSGMDVGSLIKAFGAPQERGVAGLKPQQDEAGQLTYQQKPVPLAAADKSAFKAYSGTPKKPDIATFEGEGGPSIPDANPSRGEKTADFLLAKTEDRLNQEKIKAASINHFEAEQLAEINAHKQEQLKMKLGQQATDEAIAARNIGRPEVTPPADYTEGGKPVIIPEIEKGKLPQVSAEENAADLANRKLEGYTGDKYSNTSELEQKTPIAKTALQTKVLSGLESAKLPTQGKPSWFNLLKEFGASKRHIQTEYGDIVDKKTGQSVAGQAVLREGLAPALVKLNPQKMGLDTPAHEQIGHILTNDLLQSQRPQDRKFASKYLKFTEAAPDYAKWKAARDAEKLSSTPEEYLATNAGYEFIRRQLNVDGETPFKKFYKDTLSYIKTRYGKHATDEDYARLLNYKFINDKPFNPEGRVNTPVVQTEDNTKEQKLSNESALPKYGYEEGGLKEPAERYIESMNPEERKKFWNNFADFHDYNKHTIREFERRAISIAKKKDSGPYLANKYKHVYDEYAKELNANGVKEKLTPEDVVNIDKHKDKLKNVLGELNGQQMIDKAEKIIEARIQESFDLAKNEMESTRKGLQEVNKVNALEQLHHTYPEANVRNSNDSELPTPNLKHYGHWISPSGKFHPVDNASIPDAMGAHISKAFDILDELTSAGKITTEKYNDIKARQHESGLSWPARLQNALHDMGYLRGVRDYPNKYVTNSNGSQPTPSQLRELKNLGIEQKMTIEHYKNYDSGTPRIIHNPNDTESNLYSNDSLLPSFVRPEIEKVRSLEHPEAGKVADAMTDFYAGDRTYKGQFVNSIQKSLLKHITLANPKELFTMDNPELQKAVKYMQDMSDYGKSTVTPNMAIVTDIRDWLSKLATTASIKVRQIKQDPNYFPQMPSREVLDTLLNHPTTPKARAALKQWDDYYMNTLGKTKAEADKAYATFQKGYSKQEVDLASQFGPIDKLAGLGIPPEWRSNNAMDVLSRFGNRYARRLAYHDAIESNPDVMKALGDREGMGQADVVKNVLEDIAGVREQAEANRSAVSGLVRAGMLGTLTGAKDFISNFTLGLQHMTPAQSLQSVIHSWANIKENIKGSFETGVNRYNIGTLESGDAGFSKLVAIARRSRDVLNTIQGRNLLEKAARAQAFGQGKFVAMDNIMAAKKGKLSYQQTKFLDEFAPEDWRVKYKPTGIFPAEVLNEVAAKFVESVQGTYDYRGLPSIAQKGTFSPYLSLARWNIEKLNNFDKHVVQPAKEGNFTPLLMSTVGMIIGGEAVNQIVQLATDKKEKTPKYKEIAALANDGGDVGKAIAYKLAALASLSGYAGMAGDLVKGVMDWQFHNKPQAYDNPLVSAIVTSGETGANLIQAIQSGDLNVTGDAISKLLEDSIQVYRLGLTHASPEKQRDIEEQNKLRDLKLYKTTHDLPQSETSGMESNPFKDKDIKDFKKEKDIGKAVGMLPKLLEKAVEKANGNPEILKSELEKLKGNSYQTMPSPDNMPLTFKRYYDFLHETQGDKEATDRLMDYLLTNAIDKAKTSMVPSI